MQIQVKMKNSSTLVVSDITTHEALVLINNLIEQSQFTAVEASEMSKDDDDNNDLKGE